MNTSRQASPLLEALDRCGLLGQSIAALVDYIFALRSLCAELRDRLGEATRQLGQNSLNSNWPPSSDKPTGRLARRKRKREAKTKAAAIANQEAPSPAPSPRHPGGQPGHRGTTLRAVEKPDQRIVHLLPQTCPHCAHDIKGLAVTGCIKRQVFDLPKPQPLEVTEHLAHKACCPHCHHSVSGSFPNDVSAHVQYGPRLKAAVIYYMDAQLLPCERTAQTLAETHGVSISQGTLINIANEAGVRAQGTYEAILEAAQKSPVKHADEP